MNRKPSIVRFVATCFHLNPLFGPRTNPMGDTPNARSAIGLGFPSGGGNTLNKGATTNAGSTGRILKPGGSKAVNTTPGTARSTNQTHRRIQKHGAVRVARKSKAGWSFTGPLPIQTASRTIAKLVRPRSRLSGERTIQSWRKQGTKNRGQSTKRSTSPTTNLGCPKTGREETLTGQSFTPKRCSPMRLTNGRTKSEERFIFSCVDTENPPPPNNSLAAQSTSSVSGWSRSGGR